MRGVFSRFLFVLAFQATAIGGCNEVTFSNTEPLTLYVSSLDEPSADHSLAVPLEGAKVCQTDTSNCDYTDETGLATIELPLFEETSFTVVADQHVSYLVPVVMPHPPDDLFVRTQRYMEGQFERLMTDPMEGTGAILAIRYERSAGTTFELDGATAVPFYADEDGLWSLDLSQTTDAGVGGFVEVPPGDRYTIRAGGDARDCSVWWGWPHDDRNSCSFPVRQNYLTFVELFCPL